MLQKTAKRIYARHPGFTEGKRVLIQTGPYVGQPAIILDEVLIDGKLLCQLECSVFCFQAAPEVDITIWQAPFVDFSDIPAMEIVPATKDLPTLEQPNVEAVRDWLKVNHCLKSDRSGEFNLTAHGRAVGNTLIRQNSPFGSEYERWLNGGLYPDAAMTRTLTNYVYAAFERDDMRALDVFVVSAQS